MSRIIAAIRPLVLPKLREEYEAQRQKSKGKKKKNVKDIVVEDDFEVAIFLTNDGARHSLCVKGKVFTDKKPMESNSSKLMDSTGHSAALPVSLDEDTGNAVIREESEDEQTASLTNIPAAYIADSEDEDNAAHSNKRRRSDTDPLFVENDDTDDDISTKRIRIEDESDEELPLGGDDKKKMAMNTIYDGFSIHAKALCLVVKRRDQRVKAKSAGQAMMEDWITATQTVPEDVV